MVGPVVGADDEVGHRSARGLTRICTRTAAPPLVVADDPAHGVARRHGAGADELLAVEAQCRSSVLARHNLIQRPVHRHGDLDIALMKPPHRLERAWHWPVDAHWPDRRLRSGAGWRARPPGSFVREAAAGLGIATTGDRFGIRTPARRARRCPRSIRRAVGRRSRPAPIRALRRETDLRKGADAGSISGPRGGFADRLASLSKPFDQLDGVDENSERVLRSASASRVC